MESILNDWKKTLDDLKSSIDKSLEEVRECKTAVQRMKPDFVNERRKGRFVRDDARLILSAPEIIIGDVDADGNLLSGASMAKVCIRGNDVSLEGISASGAGVGQIQSRAAIIRQIAVDPGIDGREAAVLGTSEITSQARSVSIISSSDKEVFVPGSVKSLRTGVMIHSDSGITIDSSVASETKKKDVDTAVKSLESTKKKLESSVSATKKSIDSLFKEVEKVMEDADGIEKSDDGYNSNAMFLDDLRKQLDEVASALGSTLETYFSELSSLAETCREINALKKIKDGIKSGDDYKKKSTGAAVSINGESVRISSRDGDGNIRTNDSAVVSVNARTVLVKSMGEDALIDKSSILLRSKKVGISTEDVKLKDPKNGTKGDRLAVGDVEIISKNVNIRAVDNEFDGKNPLKEKALTKDSKLSVRMENLEISATDTEGKATGKVTVNAKDITAKAMDVKKDDRSDDKLASGGTLLLTAEKLFAGSKDGNNKTKELQIAADKTGIFGDTTAEIQQAKAVVQLDGGNLSMSGGKTQVFGETTVNGKTAFKADVTAPKATIDNLEAKTSFKSTNISDGIPVPGAPSTASLSAKLKVQEKK